MDQQPSPTGLPEPLAALQALLARREMMFELCTRFSQRLLEAGALEPVIDEGLAELGRSTDVDRVYLFESHLHPDSGIPLASQRHEWVRQGVSPEIDNPQLQDLDMLAVLPRWHAAFTEGRSVAGRVADFDDSERRLLEPQKILSILVVPITLRGEAWGFLGFDSVRELREWSDDEERTLRLLAASVGAGIERRRAEADLRMAAAVFENSHDAIIVTDPEGVIVSVNPAQLRLSGFSREELIGHPSRILDTDREDEAFYAHVWQTLRETGHWRGENWNRRKDGHTYPQWTDISAVRGADDQVTHYVAVATDISQLKHAEERLQFLADHDELTELPNRRYGYRQLDAAVKRAREHGHEVAVLFVDLDGFKQVNDSDGHASGDELLRQAGRRLKHRLRGEDTIARLGGDEFLIVLSTLGQPSQAHTVALGLLERLREPFQLGGKRIRIDASIGISLYPHHGEDIDELLKLADGAMYTAKMRGQGGVHVHGANVPQLGRPG